MFWLFLSLIFIIAVLVFWINELKKSMLKNDTFVRGLYWLLKEKKLVNSEDEEWLSGYVKGTKSPKIGSMYHLVDFMSMDKKNELKK